MAEDDHLSREEQEAILRQIARDGSASASARVTAIRTIVELRSAEEAEAALQERGELPEGLALLHPSRYRSKGRPGP
jgi:hypothetical protein